MSGSEKPHFSKRVLELAEDTQAALGSSLIGKALVSAATGSNSPSYNQLNWQSKGITSNIISTRMIPGDPKVRRLTPAIAIPNQNDANE
jgi:hypothetical protein